MLAFASSFLFLCHHPLLLPESRFSSLFDSFHPRHSLIVVSQTIPIYNKTNVPSFHSATTIFLSSTLLTSPSIDSISNSRSSLDGLALVTSHVLGTVCVDMTVGVTTRSVLAIPQTLDLYILSFSSVYLSLLRILCLNVFHIDVHHLHIATHTLGTDSKCIKGLAFWLNNVVEFPPSLLCSSHVNLRTFEVRSTKKTPELLILALLLFSSSRSKTLLFPQRLLTLSYHL